VRLTTVPKALPSMPDPCKGVPNDSWCPSGVSSGSALPAHGTSNGAPFGLAAVGGLGLVTSPAVRRARRRKLRA
jgi:hypothetical protein